MKTVVYTFLAVMSFSLMSCEKDHSNERESAIIEGLEKKTGDEDEDEYLISGLVTNASTGACEVGLKVKIFKTNGTEIDVAVTNGSGHFNMDVPADHYYFEVFKDGAVATTSGDLHITSDFSIHLATP